MFFPNSRLFDVVKIQAFVVIVWMSRGDQAFMMSNAFEVVARSEQGALAAVECVGRQHVSVFYDVVFGIVPNSAHPHGDKVSFFRI